MAIMDRTESFGISLSCDWLSYKTQLWPQYLSIELERQTGEYLGSVWASKGLPGVCFCWVCGKNLLELEKNGTTVHTSLTHLIFFLKETSQQDPQISLPAIQQGNIHMPIYKFLTEDDQVFILQHNFPSTFSSHFEQNFLKESQCSYISYPKTKSCPD